MSKKLTKSRSDRKLAGVCGGLAAYFNIDATIVRLIFAIGALFSFGTLLLIYIVLYFALPDETAGNTYRSSTEDEANKSW